MCVRVCVTFERSDWPADRVYKVQWRAGLIKVGGGRRRGWGTLAGGGGVFRTGSDVIRENPVGNPSVERTTPDPKRLTRENSKPSSPLVTECKQKHMEGGGVARIYGTMVGGPNNGRRGSALRVGHLGRGVRTGSDVIRENPVGNPSVERTTPNQKSFIGVISPQHCGEDNSRCGTDNSR